LNILIYSFILEPISILIYSFFVPKRGICARIISPYSA